MFTKQDIRAAVRAARKALPEDELQAMSAGVIDRILQKKEFCNAATVLAYWPLPGEVDLRPLITGGSRRFALPVVCGDELVLKEYDPAHMAEGAFGIMEPGPEARTVQPDQIDFALIPGVAFDRSGMRLGRGRGFYDRLLPSLHCHKAGVAFPFQIFDAVPYDSWDVPMDSVIIP